MLFYWLASRPPSPCRLVRPGPVYPNAQGPDRLPWDITFIAPFDGAFSMSA